MMKQQHKGHPLAVHLAKYLLKMEQTATQQQSESRENKAGCQSFPFKMVKKQINFFNRAFKLAPGIRANHIPKVFGMFGINEKGLEAQCEGESMMFNHYANRVVERVEVLQHAILIENSEPDSSCQLPVELIVERFKSKGHNTFYELAQLIEEVRNLFREASNFTTTPKKHAMYKFLEEMGDKMYVVCFEGRQVAISKSLLTYLQYDVEELVVQTVKYRSFNHEFFAFDYPPVIKHIIKCLKLVAEFNIGKISLEDIKRQSVLHFRDYLQSKNHVRSLCDMRLYLSPVYFVHTIDQIVYKSDELSIPYNYGRKIAIEDERKKHQQTEYKILKHITNIPKGLLKENQQLIAGYKEKSISPEEPL